MERTKLYKTRKFAVPCFSYSALFDDRLDAGLPTIISLSHTAKGLPNSTVSWRISKTRPTIIIDLKMLNLEMVAPCLPSELILDLASTVETVYGNQEGAAVGANSHKPGRKSYHPLMVFEGNSRLCLNAVLRAGNVHSCRNTEEFIKQTFELLGDRSVKYARFDKGFAGEEFYSLWEMKNIGYVGKLKWTKRLQDEVAQCRCWKRFVDEEWVIDSITLIYKATSWEKARRVVVIRKAQRFYGEQIQMLLIRTGNTKPSSPIWNGNRSILAILQPTLLYVKLHKGIQTRLLH